MKVIHLDPRRRRPRSVHIYQQFNRPGWFIANLRYPDHRLETVQIPDEREALALGALWMEQGASVTLAWIDAEDMQADGPEAS